MYPELKLKPGKELPVSYLHPWIFSGALDETAKPKELKSGELVVLKDAPGNTLGVGTYSKHSMIAVRMLDFTVGTDQNVTTIDKKWFAKKFKDAQAKRDVLGYGDAGAKGEETTAYRVIFGESDGIPGLVVDRYADAIVIQISTEGIENLKSEIIDALKTTFKPRIIIERSDIQSRHEEGLKEFKGVLYEAQVAKTAKAETKVKAGTAKATTTKKSKASGSASKVSLPETSTKASSTLVTFQENGITFEADLLEGQKTGFFLDQKDLRSHLAKYTAKRKVLNVFSYTGAAGIYALKNKASHVTNVDSSEEALVQAEKNAKLNKIPKTKLSNIKDDAFQFLGKFSGPESVPEFDMTIIDPPALVKSNKDKEEGMKAYHFLNRAAIRATKHDGIFVTSSCSHYLTEDDLLLILKKASIQSKVTLTILDRVTQAPDHPMSMYFPEGKYLKSFICLVSRK